MNKVLFELKRTEEGKLTTIRLIHYCKDGKLKYYTGERIDPVDWPGNINTGVQAVLDRIRTSIAELTVDYKIKGEVLTKAILRSHLNKILNRKNSGNPEDFFGAIDKITALMEEGSLLTPAKRKYSSGSIKTFKFTSRFLKEFNPNLTITNVTLDTYSSFIKYCQKSKLSTNYIGAQIKNWKRLGKLIGGNTVYDNPGFKKIQEETHGVYLDEKEIASIFKLKLTDREAVVRDWFVLDCYTGLRVSDLVLLNKKNLHNGFITIANEKTGEKVVIPVHPSTQKILNKYNGFPPAVTDVEINRIIKSVAKQAEIEQEVLFTITKGGKRKDRYAKKWEMVTNHTARRSFITNLRKNGVPDNIVMKLTGIRSAQTLKRYDKLSADEAAKIASKLKFFK